jgi:hypothetical protein
MKPYDVEQAKEEILAAAKSAQIGSDVTIGTATNEAIRKLEVQARAFADLPRDLSSLFKDASFVEIGEIDPKTWRISPEVDQLSVSLGGPIIIYGRQIMIGSGKERMIPNKKHRILVFMIPMED